MSTTEENQQFNLDFFIKSTDVGLYNVAKKIFSYLDPPDIKNFRKIGRKNKAIDEFLSKEQDFLWNKFEKVTLKTLKKDQVQVRGFSEKNCRMLEETHRVSVWIDSKKSGPFTFVAITGNLEGVLRIFDYHLKLNSHYLKLNIALVRAQIDGPLSSSGARTRAMLLKLRQYEYVIKGNLLEVYFALTKKMSEENDRSIEILETMEQKCWSDQSSFDKLEETFKKQQARLENRLNFGNSLYITAKQVFLDK